MPIDVDGTALRAGSRALAQDMLVRIDVVAEDLRSTAEESERLCRLSPRATEILMSLGTPRLRLPASLGGFDATLTEEMTILKRLAEIDAASAWCSMVTSTATTMFIDSLTDEGFAEVFGGGERPVAVGVAAPGGIARRVEGGYVVEGRWRFCSGIHMADWVMCNPLLDGDPSLPIAVSVRREDVTIHDSWNVLGLRGTGSSDFSLESVFVPDTFVGMKAPSGRLERRHPHAPGDEHIAIALGLASRALGELRAGFDSGAYKWRDREVVQAEFSRLTIALESTEQMALHMFDLIDQCTGDVLPPDLAMRLRALGTFATELAVECALFAMRRGGGRALYMPNPIERTLRDAITAQAHVLVSDQNYATHGASALGLFPDMDLMR